MKNNKIKLIPKFENEDEERNFWATHDSTEYFDTSKPVKFDFSQLKFTTKPITLRLPIWLIADLKKLANKNDVPYQSMMKLMLAKQVKIESKIG